MMMTVMMMMIIIIIIIIIYTLLVAFNRYLETYLYLKQSITLTKFKSAVVILLIKR